MTAVRFSDLYLRHRTWFVVVGVVACTFTVLILRRPSQWAYPYIWVEAGTIMLPDFIAHGWSSLLDPVNGYLVLPTKLILATSATVSFRWMPDIAYWLTELFTICVLCAIALSPTHLKYRFVCALAILALPTDSEVFAVSSLAFWWGSLLVTLPLFWRNTGPQLPALRIAFLTIGGLSSPLLIVLSPLYALRAIIYRTRGAWLDLSIAAAVACTQLTMLWQLRHSTLTTIETTSPVMFIRKFFGYFIYIPAKFATHNVGTFLAGLLLLASLGVCAWLYRNKLGYSFYMTILAFMLTALASSARVTLVQLHPALAGPRYFFFPFIFLAWAIVQISSIDARFARIVVISTVALVARNVMDVGQRTSDRFDWRKNVSACVNSPKHTFPISYDGRAVAAWKVNISGADCRTLVKESLFDNDLPRKDVAK